MRPAYAQAFIFEHMVVLKRLGYFLVGLSIGIVFLTVFLKNKSEETGTEFCYMPNCRVLKDIRNKPFTFSVEVEKLIRERQLDTLDIKSFLEDATVDFGQSDTKSSPCKTYVIEGELKGTSALMKFKNCSKKVILESIEN